MYGGSSASGGTSAFRTLWASIATAGRLTPAVAHAPVPRVRRTYNQPEDGLPATSDLESLLGRVAWPEDVAGVALAVERIVVPPDAERDLPTDPREATDRLAGHPDRRDVRRRQVA